MSAPDLIALVDRLRALPTETEWFEFKRNHGEAVWRGRGFSTTNLRYFQTFHQIAGQAPETRHIACGESGSGTAASKPNE